MSEREKMTTDTIEMQRMTSEYYEPLYANKLDSQKEKDKNLETANLPRLV